MDPLFKLFFLVRRDKRIGLQRNISVMYSILWQSMSIMSTTMSNIADTAHRTNMGRRNMFNLQVNQFTCSTKAIRQFSQWTGMGHERAIYFEHNILFKSLVAKLFTDILCENVSMWRSDGWVQIFPLSELLIFPFVVDYSSSNIGIFKLEKWYINDEQLLLEEKRHKYLVNLFFFLQIINSLCLSVATVEYIKLY